MIEKKSMLCPNCRRLISRDEPVCPYCGMARPGALWKRTLTGAMSLRRFDPVMLILTVNVAFFLLSILINPAALGLSANPLFLFGSPARTRTTDPMVNSQFLPFHDLSWLIKIILTNQ